MTSKELNDAKSVVLTKLFEKNFVDTISDFNRGLVYEYVVYKLEQIVIPFFQKIEESNKSVKEIYFEYKTERLRIEVDFVTIKECEKEWKYRTVKQELEKELGMTITKQTQTNEVILYTIYDKRLEDLYFSIGTKIQEELENLKSQVPNDINPTTWDTAISQIKQHL